MLLATARLVLREFVDDDWAALYAIASLPEVGRYQTTDFLDEDGARQYVQGIMVSACETPRLVFDFVVMLDGVLIGRTGMRRGADPRMASIWFEIAPVHQGKGYAAEAARGLLVHAFDEIGLHRVSGDCDPRNASSARVMEKIGMRREGHLVQNVFIKGEWCDSVMFAMLASEWRR